MTGYSQLPLWPVLAFVFGAVIGSFLNVVIYRVPRGLGVSDPKRSFCPHCETAIPWYRNLPLLTWLLQRGKCAECRGPIAFRYFLVELLTAGLLAASWILLPNPYPAAFFLMVLCLLLVVISFIDAEHMVIPMNYVYVGLGIGVLGGVIAPALVFLGASEPTPAAPSWAGGGEALLGLVSGWVGLELVVLIGKLCFGARRMNFEEESQPWILREPQTDQEELRFVVGDEHLDWSDVFYRKKDRIEIDCEEVVLNGKKNQAKRVVILATRVMIGEKEYSIANLKSLEGKAKRVVIPREAMGGGDPPLLGMIGAFLGWQAVIFTLFAAGIFALFAAFLGRIGFGRQLPFGPFLALGALTWAFRGWRLWEMYLVYAGLK